MGVAINDGTTGQQKLEAVVKAGLQGFERYKGAQYDSLPGSDQHAIGEAFGKLTFDAPKADKTAISEPVAEPQDSQASEASSESGETHIKPSHKDKKRR